MAFAFKYKHGFSKVEGRKVVGKKDVDKSSGACVDDKEVVFRLSNEYFIYRNFTFTNNA